ncbi:MAG: hypothetical protein KC620_05895, partial [Myxococcales bacterium]|nr:hypothetical protein [Myxococcales bacterium]
MNDLHARSWAIVAILLTVCGSALAEPAQVERVHFESHPDRLDFTLTASGPIDGSLAEVIPAADGEVLIIRLGGITAERRWMKMRDPLIKRALLHPSKERPPGAILRVRFRRPIINRDLLKRIDAEFLDGPQTIRISLPRPEPKRKAPPEPMPPPDATPAPPALTPPAAAPPADEPASPPNTMRIPATVLGAPPPAGDEVAQPADKPPKVRKRRKPKPPRKARKPRKRKQKPATKPPAKDEADTPPPAPEPTAPKETPAPDSAAPSAMPEAPAAQSAPAAPAAPPAEVDPAPRHEAPVEPPPAAPTQPPS